MPKSTALIWKWIMCGAAVGLASGYVLHNILGPHQSLLTSKLLDWPFLTFLMFWGVVGIFYESLTAAISRGELTIGWGKDQSISIRNLSSAVSGELDPIKEDVAFLKESLAQLRGESLKIPPNFPDSLSPSFSFQETESTAPEEQRAEAKTRRLREALMNPKYKWRTIERLASMLASSEDDVVTLLLTMDDVRLSRSMTGNQIAGLRSRVGSP